MKLLICAALAAAGLALSPIGQAQAQDDIWSHTVNNATNNVWTMRPERPRPREIDAPDFLGGKGRRIQGHVTAHPWDIQASSPVGAAIHQGDLLMIILYARAEQPAEGGSVLPVYVQMDTAPYSSVLSSNQAISGEWADHCAIAVASQDIAAGHANVNVHFGASEQVIDLGPVFVFNFGQNYDRASLPHCDG